MEITTFYLLLVFIALTFAVAGWSIVYAFSYLIKHMMATGEWDKPLPARRKMVVDPSFVPKELYIETLAKQIVAYIKVWWETPEVVLLRDVVSNFFSDVREMVIIYSIFLHDWIRIQYHYLMSKPKIRAFVNGAWKGSGKLMPLIKHMAKYIEKNISSNPGKKHN